MKAAALVRLQELGMKRGGLIAVAVSPRCGLAIVANGETIVAGADESVDLVRDIEDQLRPRWIWWSNDVPAFFTAQGIRIATCWDLSAVHRLLFGGWQAEPASIWAHLRNLPEEHMPTSSAPNLFTYTDDDGDFESPIRPDGYLRPDWAMGGWAETGERLARWAHLAGQIAVLQLDRLRQLQDRPHAEATARSESAAELLCAELSADGLPMRRDIAESIVEGIVGPRPSSKEDVFAQRAGRDASVLKFAPEGVSFDLRSPGQVRELLQRAGFDLPDTRAWRLRALAGTHPLIEPLLVWRKAERVATTYGYSWLDEQLGPDGRLRGAWTGCDGAAGRMTASSGLHNMPAEMRDAVIAEAGHVFVRADLGQIEPRVLASVSGDSALALATQAEDMYAPVAMQLGVDRATAKVAVLGAMYGQTTGDGARALRRLESAYPVAMKYLAVADRSGQEGHDLRTHGGRLIRMRTIEEGDGFREARSASAAQGRYGRNALVQGAAAELFKVWAAIVRSRGAVFDARIVLCLHDELLVHVPVANAERTAQLLDDCLQEAARSWAPDDSVRFLAEIDVVDRWSDASDHTSP